ncbi:MAG TPA: hypothetical protein ENG12_05425 [Candidatus Altiarchaeales archaeon]|nr:hypothetical protein [Candidatus Altiarchaeales archaeon]
MKTISIRLDEGFVREIEHLAEYTDRSSFIRMVMQLGLEQYRIELAIQKYVRGEISTWKAAEIAGVSLRRMMGILKAKGIDMHYSEESLKEDLTNYI